MHMCPVDQCTCLHFVGLSHTETSKHAVEQEGKCQNITLSVNMLLGTSVQGAALSSNRHQRPHKGSGTRQDCVSETTDQYTYCTSTICHRCMLYGPHLGQLNVSFFTVLKAELCILRFEP